MTKLGIGYVSGQKDRHHLSVLQLRFFCMKAFQTSTQVIL